MSGVKNGNLENMAVLFERYHVRLYNFFGHMGIEKDASSDLTQNLFYRMIKYRTSYNTDKNFKSWMYRIARNLCNDYLNELKIHNSMILLNETYPSDVINEEPSFTEDDYQMLDRALMQLSPDQRELIVLSRFQGLQYNEVSAITGQSIASIKTGMFRAIKKLRSIYFRQL